MHQLSTWRSAPHCVRLSLVAGAVALEVIAAAVRDSESWPSCIACLMHHTRESTTWGVERPTFRVSSLRGGEASFILPVHGSTWAVCHTLKLILAVS